MNSFFSINGHKLLLVGALFLAPFAHQEAVNGDNANSYRSLAAEPIIADLRVPAEKEATAVPEIKTGLSDTWKYAISGLALLLFLGLALFIQLRAEREK